MTGRPPRQAPPTASIGACPACGADVFPGDRFCGGCGAAIPQGVEVELLADLEEVTRGEYEILGVLGRGGMGLVYLGHDISLGRKVAIKVLPPSMLQGEAAVERFRREARIAAGLRHRNITSVFGLKETTKLVFFVMEYVEGRTLDAILRDEKQLAVDVVQAILQDAAGALSYAHRRDIVHRDLKPANIIVDVDGMAMITDFGVAKLGGGQGLTTVGATVGSPKYMSPEQWSGKATSFSDQYAIGVVAYELLAGRGPFEGDTIEEFMKQHLFDPPPALTEFRPETPRPLADGIMRMLAKDAGERWPSFEAAVAAMGVPSVGAADPVRETLARFAKRGHEVRALPKTPKSPIPVSTVKLRRGPTPGPKAGSRRALLFAVAALVLVGLGVGGYLLVPRPPTPTAPSGPGGEAVAGVEITGAPATLGTGARAALEAHVKNSAGAPVANAHVAWSTSDSTVAAVAEDGVVRAMGPGTATVTASSGGKSAGVKIVVAPPAPPTATVAALEVAPHTVRLAPAGSVRIVASAVDAKGSPVTGRRVEWSTSDPTVVAVSTTGVLTGRAPGNAVVTAASEGLRATVAVSVEAPTPAKVVSLEVVPQLLQLAVKGTATIGVTVRDARGNVVRRPVEWTSSTPAIAFVGGSGTVTGVAPGRATVTAQSEGVLSPPVHVTVVGAGPGPPGVLQLLLQPAWAFVSIDGLPRGQRTRLVDTLPSGVVHRLHFERQGFTSVDTTVSLQPGEERLIRILMIPK